VFNVRLEDILDRKHLPPLGLKDFEEWLLYVELSPENLYFILWLREYTVRYRHWTDRSKSLRDDARQYHGLDWPANGSSQLAMFYARAKQTFFTPNSHYELNLPSDMLAPFHIANSSPHPDPVIFDQVAIEAQKLLKESLQRFVSAQFNNVGNNRVICGLIGGTVFCLVGALLPIIYNFAMGHSRWARLSALPGLWLGLSVLFASLHGVCLGVYIFGDLRQLRKFELTRPPISKPQPYRAPRQRPVISSPITGLTVSPGSIIPMSYSTDSIIPPPPAHTHLSRSASRQSMPSTLSRSTSSNFSYSGTDGMIHISPAYYDPEPIEGPATSPVSDTGVFTFPVKPKSQFDHDDDDRHPFGATATFIHPFDHLVDEDDPSSPTAEERQRVSAFDFDALPPPPLARMQPQPLSCPQPRPDSPYPTQPNPPSTSSLQLGPSILVIQPETEPNDAAGFLTPKGFIRRIQSRCNINRWLVMTSSSSSTDLNEKAPDDLEKAEYERSNFPRPHPSRQKENNFKRQFKMVKAVPAFASPLTRVLSPVVIRGQWEIVVRSMIIACFVSWFAIGLLLAVPVPKRH